MYGSIFRKCSQLRARDLQPHTSHHHSCTKATMFQCQAVASCQSLPTNCRRLLWNEIEIKDKSSSIGKGAFGSCFIAKLGGMDMVCLKVLHADPKFKFLFYTEVKILLLLCHVNLPWLLGACDSDRHVAIAMTYHPFRGEGSSTTVYDALSRDLTLTSQNWKQIISGIVAALNYICLKNVIHNDIKSDNVLIEMLGSDYTDARAILIDFNKACFLDEAKRYKLSHENEKKYAKDHPQIAPEVRKGLTKQSFASDIYSVGRVIRKINSVCLKIDCIQSLSELCTSEDYEKRPTASELCTFFSNLFT